VGLPRVGFASRIRADAAAQTVWRIILEERDAFRDYGSLY